MNAVVALAQLNSGRVGFQVGARLTETTRLGSSVSNSSRFLSLVKFFWGENRILKVKIFEVQKYIWVEKSFSPHFFFHVKNSIYENHEAQKIVGWK